MIDFAKTLLHLRTKIRWPWTVTVNLISLAAWREHLPEPGLTETAGQMPWTNEKKYYSYTSAFPLHKTNITNNRCLVKPVRRQLGIGLIGAETIWSKTYEETKCGL